VKPHHYVAIVMLGMQGVLCILTFCEGDWRKGLYWLGAFILTIGVTI
jgi:hypothetical protein